MQKNSLFVADYQHVSLIEYPGKISSIIFTHGCSLRCRYCHNPALVRSQKGENRLADFLEYLEGKEIEAVAVTGGEPLLSAHLADFLRDMKTRGLSVKLDTNGFHPKRLEDVCRLGLSDYAAVDLKSFSADRLKSIVRADVVQDKLYETLNVLKKYSVPFEIRHTLWEIPAEEDVADFAMKSGCQKLYVQKIRPSRMLDKTFSPPNTTDAAVTELFHKCGIEAVIR